MGGVIRSIYRKVVNFNLLQQVIIIASIYKILSTIKKNIFSFSTGHQKNYLNFYKLLLESKYNYLENFSQKLTSQLGQELLVISELNFKKNGYFVEFGATDGFDLSNTYFLEKHFNWQGIVAEPAKCFHDQLTANRNCKIDSRCVWHKTGETLDFNQTACAELSTIASCADRDLHHNARKDCIAYKVETISLIDLLTTHNAPKVIDYLSIDTEGSEYEILAAFDFNAYDIKIITVEHNYNSYREKIYELLISHGYRQVYKHHSQWDDWYIKNTN